MKKLNSKEMAQTVGAGCRWIKVLAKEALHGGNGDLAERLTNDWLVCGNSAQSDHLFSR
jgi:hypothetical protein